MSSNLENQPADGLSINRHYDKSQELFAQAQKVIPGGVNSPVRAFASVGGEPIFFESGNGSEVTDVDGNVYIDFCGSWGPLILGHVHPHVVNAATEALKKGLSFGACNEKEIQLAQMVLKAFPEFDMTRFVSSGTEAVMTAIRLARGVTKRSKIIKFNGCYHGHADHLLVKAGSGLVTQPLASSLGVPQSFAQETLVANLDDEDSVEKLFQEHGKDIAAIIIEPMPANSGLLEQRKEFLQFLRGITLRYESLLIFDEVISGFRLQYGGYMHRVGIKPDIVTLGKIVGGGMPVGALISTEENMSQLAPLGGIYQAGTLSGNPVAMAAGIATLEILNDPASYKTLEELGQVLDKEFNALKDDFSFFNFKRIGSVFWLHLDKGAFPTNPDAASPKAVERYNHAHRRMLNKGIYLAPSAWEVSFISLAHTKENIEKLAWAWRDILPSL